MSVEATNQETYTALVDYIEDKGYPPTVRELGKALGLSSPDAAWKRLVQLEKAGMIERVGGRRLILLKGEQ